MIKILLSGAIILALIGGAVQFESTPQNWIFKVNKKNVLSSVENGMIKIYDFSKSTIDGTDTIKSVPEKNLK